MRKLQESTTFNVDFYWTNWSRFKFSIVPVVYCPFLRWLVRSPDHSCSNWLGNCPSVVIVAGEFGCVQWRTRQMLARKRLNERRWEPRLLARQAHNWIKRARATRCDSKHALTTSILSKQLGPFSHSHSPTLSCSARFGALFASFEACAR